MYSSKCKENNLLKRFDVILAFSRKFDFNVKMSNEIKMSHSLDIHSLELLT